MSPLFEINFRREAWRRQRARARNRVIALGVWVTYFGVLAVVLGLYGLNCAVLDRRVERLEAQAARVRASRLVPERLQIGAAELTQVEKMAANPRRWRDRLARLGTLLPANVALTSVALNPDNVPSAAEQSKLVITGVLKSGASGDRMAGVMQLVSMLHGDSTFATGYQSIRLVRSSLSADTPPATEFVIECR